MNLHARGRVAARRDNATPHKSTYHYEYAVYTNNLCWGRVHIGTYATRFEARRGGLLASKGAFDIKRVRVYNERYSIIRGA